MRNRFRLLCGDSLSLLKSCPDNYFHSVVCDPPYGLEFMGKTWDRLDQLEQRRGQDPRAAGRRGMNASALVKAPGFDNSLSAKQAFQAWCTEWAQECYRVLKPGGYLLAFGGTRMYHRLASGVEDAGFEIRDSVWAWVYGQGMPKGQNVAKAIDKAERGVPFGGKDPTSPNAGRFRTSRTEGKRSGSDKGQSFGAGAGAYMLTAGEVDTREVQSEAAKSALGWNTQLRPSCEPIVVARKPLSGTAAENWLEHRTGPFNVDATRIGTSGGSTIPSGMDRYNAENARAGYRPGTYTQGTPEAPPEKGRWPANTILMHHPFCVLDADDLSKWICHPDCHASHMDQQSGTGLKGGGAVKNPGSPVFGALYGEFETRTPHPGFSDEGGASRYFYIAKSSQTEKHLGCTGLYWQTNSDGTLAQISRQEWKLRHKANRKLVKRGKKEKYLIAHGNAHVTVKPVDLMRYLVRLVTVPGGKVLDPFMGSGTTGMACAVEGMRFTGIDLDPTHVIIAKSRIKAAVKYADAIREGDWGVEKRKVARQQAIREDPRHSLFG